MQQNILKIDFKNIHIGSLILKRVTELEVELGRICRFLKCSEIEIQQMYEATSLDTEILLRWSKLLEYDFFRVYNQHLILYAPQGKAIYNRTLNEKKSVLPQFKKNIYTREVIDFILEQIDQGEMTKTQVIKEYRIPKTTLYKWLKKYNLDSTT
ncbi:MAG: transposase [Chryseobacterium sp.]|jgi:DNA-binding NtrC family response regulator|uniref:transposase n=1 Tax=Chryseobacterium sp. TaxID=1871047 RepID=UPI002610C73A|nr:transposase [Chryseobacterium sp.]MDF2553961.1 transposase [Chryseobacterium sp.]